MTHRMQVSIPYFTGLPSDVLTNTFHFNWLGGGTPSEAALGLCAENVEQWYESTYQNTSGLSIGAYTRPLLTTFKMYDLSEPQPRVPVYDAVRPLTVTQEGVNGTIPPEVAIVNSYHTEFVSGAPRASQRGRIYIGALGNVGLTPGNSSAFPFVGTSLREAMCARMATLASASLTDQWGWVVYSRKLSQSYAVAGGWVDDAYDTQRRRGNGPTVRSTWSDS